MFGVEWCSVIFTWVFLVALVWVAYMDCDLVVLASWVVGVSVWGVCEFCDCGGF